MVKMVIDLVDGEMVIDLMVIICDYIDGDDYADI